MKVDKKKLWIFTFEYAGVAKVGGLGEVPANQAVNLKNQYDITVFMPSHGQIEKLKKNLEWEKLPFNSIGQVNPSIFEMMDSETSYNISFYKFKIKNVQIILLSGENSFTRKLLDDINVYNPNTINGKICLFSLGISGFIEYLLDNRKEDLANVVHLHDYHVVLPFIVMKQKLAKNNLDIPSLITLHLLTWPRFNLDFYRACSIDNTPIKILQKKGFISLTIKEIFSLALKSNALDQDYKPPTVEIIGAIVCDLVTTVSESYLISDIIPNCGQDLIEFKADFVWDGCDWDYFQIYNGVFETHEEEMHNILGISHDTPIKREDMKRYLLEYKMGHLSQSPLINSQKILDIINEISNGNPFIKNGNIKAFSDSGPLVISTGRISPQKGFDVIFKALPDVIKVVPNAKFLLLILPTDYSLDEIKNYAQFVKKYPENIRIIFGVASDIFYLAHIAADVYCALSRWEPFGIMALEAMASKIPIIATKVGGLQETVVDMRIFPEIGTGILIEKDNPKEFADALISLFKSEEVANIVSKSNQHSIYEAEILNNINQIPDEIIKSRVLIDYDYYYKIRENCYKRVKNHFTWNIVTKKLIELYSNVQRLRSKF
ncbi:MAG: glycosyltransferase [Candidatus Hodarchaeota archaeon]